MIKYSPHTTSSYNYEALVIKKRIIKKSDVQIIIPTYKAYEKLHPTLKSLLKQKGIKFDVLIIDNGGKVYKKLLKDFPTVNFIALKKNLGHAGGQIIGAEIAFSLDYYYIIFSVNDVELISTNALRQMKLVLDSDKKIGAVAPVAYQSPQARELKPIPTDGAFFIYLFTKAEVIKKVGLHDFNLFIYGEDAQLSYKITKYYQMLLIPQAIYMISSSGINIIQNKHAYYCLRALLYVALKASNVSFKHRFNSFYYFLLKVIQLTLMSIIYSDFSYFHTIILASLGGINLNKDLTRYIKTNKYYLAPEKGQAKGALLLTSHSLLKKNKYYFTQSSSFEKKYYKIKKKDILSYGFSN